MYIYIYVICIQYMYIHHNLYSFSQPFLKLAGFFSQVCRVPVVRIDSHRFQNEGNEPRIGSFRFGSSAVRVEICFWSWSGSIQFGSFQYLMEFLLFSKAVWEVIEVIFIEAIETKPRARFAASQAILCVKPACWLEPI